MTGCVPADQNRCKLCPCLPSPKLSSLLSRLFQAQGGKISGFYKQISAETQFEVVLTGKGADGAVGYCAENPDCTRTNGQL